MILKDNDGLTKQGILTVKENKHFGSVKISNQAYFSIPYTSMLYFKTHKGVKLDFDYYMDSITDGTLVNCGYGDNNKGWDVVNYGFLLWFNRTKVEVYIKLPSSSSPIRINSSSADIVYKTINKFSLIGPTETDSNFYLVVNGVKEKFDFQDKIREFWSNYGVNNKCEGWTFGDRNMLNYSPLNYSQLLLVCVSVFDKENNEYTNKHLYGFDAINVDDRYVPDKIGGCNGVIIGPTKITNNKYRLVSGYSFKEQRVLARVEEKLQKFDYFINAAQGNVGTDNWYVRRTGGSDWGSYAASTKPIPCGELTFTYTKYVGINSIGLTDNLIPPSTYSLIMYGFYIYDQSDKIRMIYNHADSVDVAVPKLGDVYSLRWEIGQPVKFYINNVLKHTFPGIYEQPLYPATAIYSWVPTDYHFNFKIIQKTLTVQGIRRPSTKAYSFLEYNQIYNNLLNKKIINSTGIDQSDTNMYANAGVTLSDWLHFNGDGYSEINLGSNNYVNCVALGKFFASMKFKITAKHANWSWSVLMNAAINFNQIFDLGVNTTTGRLVFRSQNREHSIPDIMKIEIGKEYCICVCVNKQHARIMITDGKKIGFHEVKDYVVAGSLTSVCFGMGRGGYNYLVGSIKNIKVGNMILSNDEMSAIIEEEINY